ncbi:MAG TPA: sigma-54 dependent transcriptional regulator, partial [Gemmatimonadales bacterium]|nr:sigma-54 dependent transcriptional regulator [Gemmatimonadales bacterium]
MRTPGIPGRSRATTAGAAPGGNVADLVSVSPEERAKLRLLVVDDERTLRESCVTVLEHEGYNVTSCSSGGEAIERLKRQPFDIVLCDLYMEPVSGLEVLKAAVDLQKDIIVIVITGNPTVASSVEVLRAGAWDYLPKPFSATHLQILIGRAAHAVRVARESKELQTEIERSHGNSEKVTVLGISPAFRRAIELARKVAPTDASVLLTGESGTGKELFAQFIHQHSRRSARSFVPINCAAMPEGLLESEMFGHVKGAFTGALRDKPGLLETANGGTLFMDELLEMPKPTQAKLLRVIQDGVVRRVGSEHTDAVVNVRFIAATNGDPEQCVKEGTLREDLYYRLYVVPIHIPPLRDRKEDIPVLANFFLQHYWARHSPGAGAPPKFTEGALRALQSHPWRGNVREMQNVVEHTVVMLEPGSEIQPDQIPLGGGDSAAGASSAPVSRGAE